MDRSASRRYHHLDLVVLPGHDAAESFAGGFAVPELERVDGFDDDSSGRIDPDTGGQHGIDIGCFGLHCQRQSASGILVVTSV